MHNIVTIVNFFLSYHFVIFIVLFYSFQIYILKNVKQNKTKNQKGYPMGWNIMQYYK